MRSKLGAAVSTAFILSALFAANGTDAEPQSLAADESPALASAREQLASDLLAITLPDDRLMLQLMNKLNPIAQATDAVKNNPKHVEAMRQAELTTAQHAIPELKRLLALIYANELTEQQLREALAFYKTSAGTALAGIEARSGMFMEISGAHLWPRYAKMMRDDYCAKVECTDKERQTMGDQTAPLEGKYRLVAPGSDQPRK